MNDDKILENIVSAMPSECGDSVLIASDITNLCLKFDIGDINQKLRYFIDLLKSKVGGEGTLLFPTYNWNFCKGIEFNYHKTRSRTGSLGQLALKRKDFVRTHHALYSFAVCGKDKNILYNMNDENSFVGNTPFYYLHHNKGKMIMLDVEPTDCLTFVHYVEEVNQVSYRFNKKFYGKYIDENGEESERMYSMFVRYLDERAVKTNPTLNSWLRSEGILKEKIIEDIPVKYLSFDELYKLIDYDIKYNESKNLIIHTG